MNRLKDYFHFQKEEKIGFFFLVFIILAVIAYINFSDQSLDKTAQDYSEFEKKIEAFEAAVSEIPSSGIEKATAQVKTEEATKDYSLFTFDPNGLSLQDWMKLGISKAQAEVIKNYEAKGGQFFDKNDVKKMYTISDEKYKELEPYIKIDPSQFQTEKQKNTEWERVYVEEEPAYLDLNIVDSINLLKLSGIGPSFSSRILEFRRKSGGFTNEKQLLDIWGMDSLRFNKIKESVFVDKRFKLRKININTSSAKEMKEHPYISWNVANSIEKYREQNGKYTSLDEIKKSHLINDSLYNKLLPYIKLN